MKTLIIIAVILFFYLIYIIIRNITLYNSDNPALIIADEGMVENVHTKQFIEWQEIIQCRVVRKGVFDFLVLYLKNPDAFQKQTGWMNKLYFYSNKSTFQTPLAIQQTFYDADIYNIAAKINQKIKINP